MFAFGELFDDLLAERIEVAWLPAGNEALVGDALFVNPLPASILNIGLEARERGVRISPESAWSVPSLLTPGNSTRIRQVLAFREHVYGGNSGIGGSSLLLEGPSGIHLLLPHTGLLVRGFHKSPERVLRLILLPALGLFLANCRRDFHQTLRQQRSDIPHTVLARCLGDHFHDR